MSGHLPIRKGVVLIHGMGESQRGRLLRDVTNAIANWMWRNQRPGHEKDVKLKLVTENGSDEPEHQQRLPRDGPKPLSRIILSYGDQEWHIMEAWWARSFEPSLASPMVGWVVRRFWGRSFRLAYSAFLNARRATEDFLGMLAVVILAPFQVMLRGVRWTLSTVRRILSRESNLHEVRASLSNYWNRYSKAAAPALKAALGSARGLAIRTARKVAGMPIALIAIPYVVMFFITVRMIPRAEESALIRLSPLWVVVLALAGSAAFLAQDVEIRSFLVIAAAINLGYGTYVDLKMQQREPAGFRRTWIRLLLGFTVTGRRDPQVELGTSARGEEDIENGRRNMRTSLSSFVENLFSFVENLVQRLVDGTDDDIIATHWRVQRSPFAIFVLMAIVLTQMLGSVRSGSGNLNRGISGIAA